MPQFKVTANWLNIRADADGDAAIVAEMPRNTIYERGAASPDGRWAWIEAVLKGSRIAGWASTSDKWSAPYGSAAEPTEFSNAHFNDQRREEYVESILNDQDRFNFLRQSRQDWSAGLWTHAYRDGEQHYRVAADWKESQRNGVLVIRKRTERISPKTFDQEFGGAGAATYCNFNVSYCYVQAYGGVNLQDPDGLGPKGERSANMLVDYFRAHWREVEAEEAAGIANAGGFVVAAWKNPSGHGHVMPLTSGCDATQGALGLRCFHVGSGAPRRATVGAIFGKGATVEYFVDRATQDEWHSAADDASFAAAVTSEKWTIDTDLKTRPSSATAASIDAYLKKAAPGLAGIGPAVIAASQEYGINPVYIVAHAWHETGKGTSNIYLKKHNLFGWSAFDSSPFDASTGFPDNEACIRYVMGRINALYLTPGGKYFGGRACLGSKSYGMNKSYATDPAWGSKIAKIANIIENGLKA